MQASSQARLFYPRRVLQLLGGDIHVFDDLYDVIEHMTRANSCVRGRQGRAEKQNGKIRLETARSGKSVDLQLSDTRHDSPRTRLRHASTAASTLR